MNFFTKLFAFALVSLAPLSATWAAQGAAAPFGGNGGDYSGTVKIFTGDPTVIPGTAKIAVLSSKDGKSAIFRITSVLTVSGSPVALKPTILRFADGFYTFATSDISFNALTQDYPGIGRFSGKRAVRFHLAFNSEGTTGTVTGTVKFQHVSKKKVRLFMTATLKTTNGNTNVKYTFNTFAKVKRSRK